MAHPLRRTLLHLLILVGLIVAATATPTHAALQAADVPGLREVTRYDTSGAAYDVAVVNSFAYVAAGLGGLQVIDMNDPALPIVPVDLDTPGLAYAIQIVGSRAYVANRAFPVGSPLEYGSLDIVDISSAHRPTLLGRYRPAAGGDVWDVEVLGDYAYIVEHVGDRPDVSYDARLTILDVANPASPTVVSSTPLVGMNPRIYALAVGNGRAVIGSTKYSYSRRTTLPYLDMYDVSNPAAPALLDTVQINAPTSDLLIDGTTLYSASYLLPRFDLNNLAQPTPLSKDGFSGIDLVGTLLYAAGYSWQGPIVTIIDVSGNPRPVGTALLRDVYAVHRLQSVGQRVYVACGADGLVVLERVSLPVQRFLPLLSSISN